MNGMPVGFAVEFDRSARPRRNDLLVGGVPTRVLRLSSRGREALAELRAGPIRSAAAGVLARRLTDAGLAHPRPPGVGEVDLAVIVPVRDRPALLDRCLTALGKEHAVTVVDDGSVDAAGIARIAADHGAALVRRSINGGPAAARNTGHDAAWAGRNRGVGLPRGLSSLR